MAVAAGNEPIDEPRHFVTDPRVLWALDSGILPVRGGRNGAADDDHDGIDEPSDRDGITRTVPGGSAVFLQQIKEWGENGFATTAADAVCDVTLVSRAAFLAASGNGSSSQPHLTWVANSGFSAPGRVGTLFIVFQSDATNLINGDNNGATDIFRTAVDLTSDAEGNLRLVVNGNATLVSAINGDTEVGNGASTMAAVGGTNGEIVAFQSIATDLVAGFGDSNGPKASDVYARNVATNSTVAPEGVAKSFVPRAALALHLEVPLCTFSVLPPRSSPAKVSTTNSTGAFTGAAKSLLPSAAMPLHLFSFLLQTAPVTIPCNAFQVLCRKELSGRSKPAPAVPSRARARWSPQSAYAGFGSSWTSTL